LLEYFGQICAADGANYAPAVAAVLIELVGREAGSTPDVGVYFTIRTLNIAKIVMCLGS
jgi:hypothetical protein